MLNWKSRVSFPPQTFHGPSVSEDENYVKVFGSTNLLFTKNKLINPEILTLRPTQKKFTNFFWDWIGSHDSVLPQTFDSPSVSGYETPFKVSGWTNFSFRKTKVITFQISTFLPILNKFSLPWGAWIGNQDSVLPQTFHSPAVSGQETPVKVWGSRSLPFRKTKPITFKISRFSNFACLHEIYLFWRS